MMIHLFNEILTPLFIKIQINSLHASVLIFAIYSVKFIFKNKIGVRLIYFLWMLLLVRLLLPFNFQIFKISNIDPVANFIFDYSKLHLEEGIKQSNSAVPNSGFFPGIHIVTFFWLAVVVMLILKKIIVKRIFLNKLKDAEKIMDIRINFLFDECRHTLGIEKNITLLKTRLVKSPCVLGVFRYIILLPPGLLQALSDDEFKCVFYHELSHIKNKDTFVEAVSNFIKIIYFMNPLILFAFHQMKRDCEYLCDSNSIFLAGNNSHAYGNTIIKIATHMKSYKRSRNIPGVFSLLAALNNKKHIKRRLYMICGNLKQSKLLSVFSVVILLLIFGLTFTFSSFAEENNTANNMTFMNPVEFSRVTARFGLSNDPITKTERFHRGIDLARKKGSPVKSSCNGNVLKVDVRSNNGTGYGKYIIITHYNGYSTLYAKLSKIYVKEGQKLKTGDIIGLVGSTGRSTGPHLHFEILKDNDPVDPETFILFENQ